MKKIVLMMLVAMVPFLTMAQKKAKKNKKAKTEKIVESNSSYDFMVITGIVKVSTLKEQTNSKPLKASNLKVNKGRVNEFRSKTKSKINFDFGGIKNAENINLMKNARNYTTMASAVNGVANEGWEFISANVINDKAGTTHYYYMKRKK